MQNIEKMRNIGVKKGLFAITLSVIAVSCVKEANLKNLDQEQENLHEVVFHAGWVSETPATKTVLQEDGSVWWSPGDEINLYTITDPGEGGWLSHNFEWSYDENGECQGIKGRRFVATNTENAAEVTFIGNIEMVDNATYYAIYPYNDNNLIGYRRFEVFVPTIQTAVAGSYDRSALYSLAESNNDTLFFKSLCGGVKFSVSQDSIKEVSFKYTSGDPMSGRLSFDVELNMDAYYADSYDEVTVRAPENSYFEVGKYYYAIMCPSENESSMMVTYKKDDSEATYLTIGKTSIKRSIFKRLYEKDKDLSFKSRKDEAIMMAVFPDNVRREDITEIYFHPLSDRSTDINLGTDERPVYYELDGSIVHYYTPKECFNIKNVAPHMFVFCESLTKIDFSGVSTSEVTDFSQFFANCYKLEQVDLSGFDTYSAVNMMMMFDGCRNMKTLDLSSFNTSHVTNMQQMFCDCYSLETLNLSSFNTSQVNNMQNMFFFCYNLRQLDLSSFDTEMCSSMGDMFSYCSSLEKLDLSNFDVSSVNSYSGICHNLAIHRKNCVIKASEQTRELLSSEDADMNIFSKMYYVKWITPDEDFPEIIDPFEDLYKSTDYSKDKTYRLVQTATKGKGIDLVIMGDAYSDRLINEGKYDQDLCRAIEHIFSEEPLKSLREYFNVYIEYAVSENESIAAITALDLIIDEWPSSRISGGDGIVDIYLRSVFSDYGYEFVTGRPVPYTIIVSNCNRNSGTVDFFCSSTLALVALGEDDTAYHHIVCHEFGHCIGKLADEYDEYGETFDNDATYLSECERGFWPNLDITNDSSAVKWSRFLSDDRYANQGLGLYEGGYAKYAYGIWRPTENSLMRDAATGFNAPCREAIYKRVHELADDSFIYDFEQFVAFDQQAALQQPAHVMKRAHNDVDQNQRRLPSPIFIEGETNPNGASTTILRTR